MPRSVACGLLCFAQNTNPGRFGEIVACVKHKFGSTPQLISRSFSAENDLATRFYFIERGFLQDDTKSHSTLWKNGSGYVLPSSA